MRALQVQHNVRRFGAARLLSVTSPKASARIAPVHLKNVDDPPEPASVGWSKVATRLAGICGSDLALIDGHASTYFEDFVSFPLILHPLDPVSSRMSSCCASRGIKDALCRCLL